MEAELLKEINRQFEVIDDDSYVIQAFECMRRIYRIPPRSQDQYWETRMTALILR